MLRLTCNQDGSVSALMDARTAATIAGWADFGFADLEGAQAEWASKLGAAWIAADRPAPMLSDPDDPVAVAVAAVQAELEAEDLARTLHGAP